MEAGPTTPGAVPRVLGGLGWPQRRGLQTGGWFRTFVTMVDPPWGPFHVRRADARPGSETEGLPAWRPAGSHGRQGETQGSPQGRGSLVV